MFLFRKQKRPIKRNSQQLRRYVSFTAKNCTPPSSFSSCFVTCMIAWSFCNRFRKRCYKQIEIRSVLERPLPVKRRPKKRRTEAGFWPTDFIGLLLFRSYFRRLNQNSAWFLLKNFPAKMMMSSVVLSLSIAFSTLFAPSLAGNIFYSSFHVYLAIFLTVRDVIVPIKYLVTASPKTTFKGQPLCRKQ